MNILQEVKLKIFVNPAFEGGYELEAHSLSGAWELINKEATKEEVEEIQIIDTRYRILGGYFGGKLWSLYDDQNEGSKFSS